MKEITYDGNIFILPDPHERDACIVTTNGCRKKDGSAVMGAGIARYVRDTFKGKDRELGSLIGIRGNHVHNLGWCHIPYQDGRFGIFLLYSFPTKDDWKNDSRLELIRQSCREMKEQADRNLLHEIFMPCPGCSNGKLDYWHTVRPILEEELDDRFTVCIPRSIMDWKDL